MNTDKIYALLAVVKYEITNVIGIYTDKVKAIKDIYALAESENVTADNLVLVMFPTVNKYFKPNTDYSG